MAAWGGRRDGSGRKAKPNPRRERVVAAPRLKPTAPAEPKKPDGLDARVLAEMLPQLAEISQRYSRRQPRTTANNPFRLPKFPQAAVPLGGGMAMDGALVQNLGDCSADWLGGGTPYGVGDQGLQFLGYPYLSELAQRPEYRVMSETIADDATRKWIDFDVTGDEREQQEAAARDPEGHAERAADPDERRKRVAAAGKADKVKALQDDQLRLGVKDRCYDQCRNDGFFGRSHLYLDIWTTGAEPSPDELRMPIGDGRDKTSLSKVPKGSFKGLRTIEPMWTYPQLYNALNPLRPDWYNPQQWYVMGQELHVSRLQVFIGHPVSDMLKPAYAFGGLSLTQMAKSYVDIWLDTKQSVADLIRSFSVMILSTDLATMMSPSSAAALLARAAMSNMLRDNQGLQIVNKNTEEFKNVSAPLGGLHELQAQSQEHVASVHRIPLVKYTGIQPAGLNASSEGEIKVYDDTIGAFQSRFLDPNLSRIINFEQLSLFGEIDPQITHRWEPLREMTQAEKGQKEKDDKDRDQGYVDMGAISPAEVRKIIINNKDLPYTGLDPDDVPDLQQEEDDGLGGAGEPGGGEPGDDRGGGANDATGPFASDATFNESEHPRAPNGEFGSGAGTKSKPARLTPTEKAYIDSYSGDEFLKLNQKLRAGEPGGAAVAKLDSAISKFTVPAGTKLYRGISRDALKKLVAGDTIEAGQTLSDPGFLSTSTDREIAGLNSIGGVVMEIEVGEGQRGLDVGQISRNKHEREVLLPRDSKMTVLGIRAAKGPGHPIVVRVATRNDHGATDEAWSEADHPRGQPDNAGQFGPGGGGGGKTGRKYGGLYKSTGNGAKADHAATVEHVLKNPPRAGVSYRELLTRLIKDAPAHGGDADQLRRHLAEAYMLAREQLLAKALSAQVDQKPAEIVKLADRAKAKAEALGWRPPAPKGGESWADAGGASPDLRGFREGAQRDLVRRGVDTGLEDLLGFDANAGKPIAFKMAEHNGKRHVVFTPELMEAMKNPGNALEMHHNHPGDTSLSATDLECTLAYPGLAKVYAHGHGGSVYWAAGAKAGVQKAYKDAGAAVYPSIAVASMDASSKSWLHAHVINTALQRAGLVREYGCAPALAMAEMLKKNAGLFESAVARAERAAKEGLRG